MKEGAKEVIKTNICMKDEYSLRSEGQGLSDKGDELTKLETSKLGIHSDTDEPLVRIGIALQKL